MSISTSILPLTSEQAALLKSALPHLSEAEAAEVESLLTFQELTGTFVPTPRQADFLSLDCQEALYGGAAGGGKSEALLAWLAEGVKYPGYAAVIFRRTGPQLARAGGLIPKSYKMYLPMGAVYNLTEDVWTFPSGATIELGTLHHEVSKYDYQGPEYHRIAFDELTQFTESQYTYLFSRLRRKSGFPILPAMRAGANPGGEGHVWVKDRFVTDEAIDLVLSLNPESPTPRGTVFYKEGRGFVPSRLIDNPHVDRVEYEKQLEELDPVTRERLKAGDWSISPDGVVKSAWLRYCEVRGGHYRLLNPDGTVWRVIEAARMSRVQIIDCAATSDDVKKEKSGRQASFSVIATFDVELRTGVTVWVDVRRGKWEFPQLKAEAKQAYSDLGASWVGIEDEKTGRALIQELRLSGVSVRAISPGGKDKKTRAARWLNEMAQGHWFIPGSAPWRRSLVAELLGWTGHPDEPADQVDVAAYCALHSGVASCLTIPGGVKDGGIIMGRLLGGVR